MALWFPIMVNNYKVGTIELVRVDPIDRMPEENEVCIYNLKYYDGPFGYKPDVHTTIEFPYLEGNPIPLLSTALQRVRECQST